MGCGDHGRRKLGIEELLLDVGVDVLGQASLPGIGRDVQAAVEPGRQRHGDQVNDARGEPRAVDGAALVEVPG